MACAYHEGADGAITAGHGGQRVDGVLLASVGDAEREHRAGRVAQRRSTDGGSVVSTRVVATSGPDS